METDPLSPGTLLLDEIKELKSLMKSRKKNLSLILWRMNFYIFEPVGPSRFMKYKNAARLLIARSLFHSSVLARGPECPIDADCTQFPTANLEFLRTPTVYPACVELLKYE